MKGNREEKQSYSFHSSEIYSHLPFSLRFKRLRANVLRARGMAPITLGLRYDRTLEQANGWPTKRSESGKMRTSEGANELSEWMKSYAQENGCLFCVRYCHENCF